MSGERARARAPGRGGGAGEVVSFRSFVLLRYIPSEILSLGKNSEFSRDTSKFV